MSSQKATSQPEPNPQPNPRPDVPNTDPNLSIPAPVQARQSLTQQLGPVVDDIRQIAVDLGQRSYQVWSVRVRWDGGARGQGDVVQVWEKPFLPIPKVAKWRVPEELRAAGYVERGDVVLTELSPRYTEDEIRDLFHVKLGPAEDGFIELRVAADGLSERKRFTTSTAPERRANKFDWTVRLQRQDRQRNRDGVTEYAGRVWPPR